LDVDQSNNSKDNSPGRAGYANEPEVTSLDEPLLESPTGRENDYGAADQETLADDEIRRPEADAHPLSEMTAHHDPGSGAEETDDGLDDIVEAVRHAAEDIPTADGLEDRPAEMPVFERSLTQPKTVKH
jgi:hypothetical protein